MDLQAAQVLGYIASLGQPALAGLLRMFRHFDAARQFAGGGGEAANAALRRARGRDAIFSPVATGLSVFNVRPPTQDSLLVLSNVNLILRRIFFLHRNKIHLYRTPRLLHGLCVGTRCAVPFGTWLLVPLQAIARYLDII